MGADFEERAIAIENCSQYQDEQEREECPPGGAGDGLEQKIFWSISH
jgi:hypothetical protein